MRNILFLLFLVAFCSSFAYSQDIIRFKNGREFQVIILEKSEETVRYKKMDNMDGPDVNAPMSKVVSITYADGKTEVYGAPDAVEAVPVAEPAPVVDDIPVAEPAPMADDIPMAEPALMVDDVPMAEPAPEVEQKKKRELPTIAADAEKAKPIGVSGGDAKQKVQNKEKKSLDKKRERSFVDFTIQVGLNLLSNSSQGDIDFLSPSAFAELYLFPIKWLGFGVGGGFIYATSSDPEFGWVWTYGDGASAGNFITPVYGSFKFRFGSGTTVIPYAKIDLGYAFWSATAEASCPNDRPVYLWNAYGGFLKGVGAGIDFGFGLNLEASLLMFTGGIETKYKYSGYVRYYNPTVDWTFLNISIGYTF